MTPTILAEEGILSNILVYHPCSSWCYTDVLQKKEANEKVGVRKKYGLIIGIHLVISVQGSGEMPYSGPEADTDRSNINEVDSMIASYLMVPFVEHFSAPSCLFPH